MIGFSQGGGGSLAHATSMSDLVAVVVAYYPATAWTQNLPGLVKRFKVPVLVLDGEKDTYNNCCLIEHMRTMEQAAKDTGAAFELVVYPQAEHNWNLTGRNFRGDDAADAWRRARERLNQYLPLQK